MHEMSIASALIGHILEEASNNKLESIEEVELEIGALKLIVPEMMNAAFEAVTQGTIAQGAVLKIREVKALVKCKQCNSNFEPALDDFLCPKCTIADIDILQGNDIIIKSVTGNRKEQS